MNRYQNDPDQYASTHYRESDSSDEPRFDTDGSFTHSNFSFEHKKLGRFQGTNRYGERDIRHDSFQDDQFKNDYDPTYQDEYGEKHPYEHGGRENRWSDDLRSESSRENHFGKGPKGYVRSDRKIHDEACEILTKDPYLDATDIDVEVVDGCLYLKGEVATRRDKRLAEDLVDDIAGVQDVWNQLKIAKHRDTWGEELPDRVNMPEGLIKGLY